MILGILVVSNTQKRPYIIELLAQAFNFFLCVIDTLIEQFYSLIIVG